jgi:hypothetical protein
VIRRLLRKLLRVPLPPPQIKVPSRSDYMAGWAAGTRAWNQTRLEDDAATRALREQLDYAVAVHGEAAVAERLREMVRRKS